MMMPSIFGENLFDDFMDFPFDDKWEKRMNKEFFGRKNPLYGKNAARLMKTDVRETDSAYELDVDLPGFKKDEIQVELEDGYLTISAEKGLDKEEEKKGKYIRRERYAGACSRTFYVGENVERSDIKANFKHGILKLSVPKMEEKKAVEEATYQAGAREVSIIEEPIAAAIGAGIDITRPFGNMIVDIGGGTTDVAVISLGGTVVSTSIKVAGDDFDEAITRYVRKKHNLMIGERTAEDIKIQIGTVYATPQAKSMEVKGRDTITGLPKSVTLNSEEIREALKDASAQIMETIHSILEKTPPELAADVAERGIVLTGGGALLGGLEELIEEETGINTIVAEEPALAVAIGTGQYMELMSKMNGRL